ISRSYAEMEIKSNILKLIPLQGPKLVRRLGLVYRTDRHLSRAAQAFTEIVHSRKLKASS
ncbi:MAG: LysR substrate-binding domain-containing protein, partial [Acidobacteria bacterium]|nr:LysR substrate-binding domain-containing protein [Acidobacteriota bacterium]